MNLYAWRCPKCREDTPGYYTPRFDNPCRVCTSCSLLTGSIVKRFRDGPYEADAKQAPAMTTWKGYDLQEELERLTALDCMREAFPHHKPRLSLEHVADVPRSKVGEASFLSQKIRIFLWPKLSAGSALATLAHEIAHLAVGRVGHSDPWRAAFVEIVREGYDITTLEIPENLRRSFVGLDVAVEMALDSMVERARVYAGGAP